MNFSYRTFLSAVSLTICFLFLFGESLYSQAVESSSENNDIPDVTEFFDEITLDDDGVIAYDSLGDRWEYDFGRNKFIPSNRGSERGTGVPRGEVNLVPVENRCTEKRQLSDYETTVLVGYDEYVSGNIVAYKKVTVKGWVKGKITSSFGPVIITNSGQVDGDILSPKIIVKDGGIVLGKMIETEGFEIPFGEFSKQFSAQGIWIVSAFTLGLLILSLLLVALMPTQVTKIKECMSRYTIRSLLAGFVFIVVLPGTIVLFAITIVGVLLIPFLALAMLASMTVALILTGELFDKRIISRFSTNNRSLVFKAITGVLLTMLLWVVVAVLLGTDRQPAYGFGVAMLVISILISSYDLCLGVGAALLTRYGFREYLSSTDQGGSVQEAPTPAPPPIPSAPPLAGQSGRATTTQEGQSETEGGNQPPLSSNRD